ncbi:hypothetical protein AN639_06025 [Candidatus Epulonipiscium fishelsonii]|uniref:Uncharacterized protein n=1 Tax=Candidatus Epulonipiscium fishelsonii TaxID=77094 RepID=A0ACC8XDS2_9FIRM|nr:hypothetical protein AN639_06025 [Epulopiscium sp. SCG-B05WGA-EpuloA1]ONI41069.1 hypothetical protein AN396_04780 [Epulopiscium sp. SCG-B11WGA-EpuloA1]
MPPINSVSNTQNIMTYTNSSTKVNNTIQQNTINLPVQKPAPLIDSVYLSERGVKLSKESATVHEPNNNSSTFSPDIGITVKPGKAELYDPDTDEPDGEFIELQYDKDGALSAMFFGKDNWTDDMMATVNRAEGYFFNDMKQAIEDSIMSGFDGDKVYEDALV